MRLGRPRSLLLWSAWHFVALAALCTVPVQLRLGPVWELDPSLVPFIVGVGVAYFTSAASLTVAGRRGRPVDVRTFAGAVVLPLTAFFFYLLVAAEQYPRSLLVLFAVAAPAALLLPMVLRPAVQQALIGANSVAIATAIAAGLVQPPTGSVERRIAASSLYNLELTYYRNFFGNVDATGGALEPFGDGYLIALADGRLRFATLGAGGLEVTELPSPLPMNREGFLRDASAYPEVDTRWLRATDLLIRELEDRTEVFAAYHRWDAANACVTLRVSATEGPSNPREWTEARHWEPLFETTPCLPFKGGGNSFGGHFAGGKLALLDETHLLLTVGDHEFDGYNADRAVSQEDSVSYGKTILLDLDSGDSRVFTKGHRNPQGLYVDPEGVIWLTEQGPRGGDELNRIVEGANYGWPLVTYGTDYSLPIWPLSLEPGRHEGYEKPLFSWVPSIAVSALIGVEGGPFDLWKGDLLAGALGSQTIWRIRLDGERVVLAEPIAIDERVRDLVMGPDGRVILLTEGQDGTGPVEVGLVVLEPVPDDASDRLDPAERGALLFTQCVGCHSTDPSVGHRIGPDLSGVVGRRVASASGFAYSEGLSRLGGDWTESGLDRFLASPQEFAPGTAMEFNGIGDPDARAALIGHLRTLSPRGDRVN